MQDAASRTVQIRAYETGQRDVLLRPPDEVRPHHVRFRGGHAQKCHGVHAGINEDQCRGIQVLLEQDFDGVFDASFDHDPREFGQIRHLRETAF